MFRNLTAMVLEWGQKIYLTTFLLNTKFLLMLELSSTPLPPVPDF
jgi:hypothetical protein